jgi:hypothetical protein
MSRTDGQDVFGSPSRLAPPGVKAVQRSVSRGTLRGGGSPLADALDGADGGASRFSLAHELAAALMPEPSAGAALLDEFGIDYDEGAEGIDDAGATPDAHDAQLDPALAPADDPAFAESPLDPALAPSFSFASEMGEAPAFGDSTSGSPAPKQRRAAPAMASPTPSQDPIELLTRDLAATETFLGHLRRIDTDGHAVVVAASGSTSSPALEQLATDIIRRINDSARDRESQVRQLLEVDRELRKIGAEVGGDDVLGSVDALDDVPLSDKPSTPQAPSPVTRSARTSHPPKKSTLQVVDEDDDDWEAELNRRQLMGDEDEDEDDGPPTPRDASSSAPPPPAGPATPAATLSQLAHLRAVTADLIGSLSTISEQTQVNGAASADAGRKIRALKNKMGGMQADWEGAERARVRIERWESGAPDGPPGTPHVTPSKLARRVDGRKVVEEHLRAFELAITEASTKTQAIMAGGA